MGRTQAAGRNKCEEEGRADRMRYGLTTTSHPHLAAPLGQGSEVGESGMKNGRWTWEERGEDVGTSCFNLPLLLTTQIYFNWQEIKITFCKPSLLFTVMLTGGQPPWLSSTARPWYTIFFPVLLKRGSELVVGLWTHHTMVSILTYSFKMAFCFSTNHHHHIIWTLPTHKNSLFYTDQQIFTCHACRSRQWSRNPKEHSEC